MRTLNGLMSEHILPTSATMGPPPCHHINQNQKSSHLAQRDENTQPEHGSSPLSDALNPITISANMSRDELYKASKWDNIGQRDYYF